MHLCTSRGWVILLPIVVATLLLAQDWKTAATLNGVDFSGLTAAQKTHALNALRSMGCTCDCDMKVAECRVMDPNCSYSRGLASAIVDAIRQGKTEAAALEAAKASKFGHQVEHKVLDEPVSIPTQGAPET